ncbi:rpsU-divergently transcribed protein [Acetobacter sp. AN02]|uniref:rpsU-divergently transcribed protein n=1 Tax=Acetobacter sp. AN02 TaxID=2894186 RepID=UPI002434201C|nr:rpsU-divergently transcribed protein [Acetobacter sp. AN02]MDG6095360.1 rpsU-divergently transcribed protein [Acetobacter sp. AN02]
MISDLRGMAAGAGMLAMTMLSSSGPKRSEARDVALRALARAAGEGADWSVAVLRQVAGPDADLLFPGGEAEMAEAWADLLDRDMRLRMEVSGETRLSRLVRAAVLARLPDDASVRLAERKALSVLVAHGAAGVVARITARTVNAIWQAAGDEAQGVTWVTKRVSLGSVYTSVFLFWLSARGGDRAAVEQCLDDGLRLVLSFGRLKSRVAGFFPGRAVRAG